MPNFYLRGSSFLCDNQKNYIRNKLKNKSVAILKVLLIYKLKR